MPLDNFISTIETLQERINTHRSDLAANETRTRVALIDPMLQALGWDPANPGHVMVEQKLSEGQADYALLKPSGDTIAIVEAKALGSQLGRVTGQLVRYAFADGIPYAVSTDGDWWHVYDLTKPSTHIDNRLIMQLSLENSTAHECAIRLLLLWHSNFTSGAPVEAEIPVVPQNDDSGDKKADISTLEAKADIVNSGWISLDDCNPPTGTRGPLKVRFPDGSSFDIHGKSWSGLFETTVRWLWENSKLTHEDIPVTYNDDHSKVRYILNTIPESSPGNTMPYYKQMDIPPLYFINYYGMVDLINCTRRVLENSGQDAGEVYILPRQ